ncbi:UNVERIFIED_CONTAM: hypothetical protein FKN15_005252 [Acipenser sinensis]
MREPSPPTGSHHCKSAAASKGPDTGERGKEKGRQELTHSFPVEVLVLAGVVTAVDLGCIAVLATILYRRPCKILII